MAELISKICTQNDCVKQNSKLRSVSYLIVHSPGVYPTIVLAASGKNPWYTRWNKAGVEKMVHGFLDHTGAYQFAPLDLACWQVGTDYGNYNCIGFEFCELSSQEEFDKMWEEGVKLYAWLCRQYGLGADKILGHYEAHERGFASNHADPKPYFDRFGKTMDQFREAVKKELSGEEESEEAGAQVEVSQVYNPWKYAKVCNLTEEDPRLNVRKGPGTQYEVIRQLANGNEVDVIEAYTNGWSKINIVGQTGYVNAHYLNITDREEAAQPVPQPEELGISYKVGQVYTLTVNLNVRIGPGTSHRQKQRAELTVDGQKNAKAGTMAVLKSGTRVTVKEVQKDGSGNVWIRIPSGWVCAVYQGNNYIS